TSMRTGAGAGSALSVCSVTPATGRGPRGLSRCTSWPRATSAARNPAVARSTPPWKTKGRETTRSFSARSQPGRARRAGRARRVVERDLADHLDPRPRGPAARRLAARVGADHDQPRAGPDGADRLHEVVHALVAARRAEEHHHALGAEPERRARRDPIIARG